MKRLFIYSLILFLVPVVAFGSSTVRTSEMVSINPDQIVEGDFYGLGNNIAISGEVESDLLTLGGDLSVNGKVGADLFALTGRADIAGVVGDDVRIIAGDVIVSGEVAGDLVVIAGSLKVLPDANVAGDVMFFGSEANISGVVAGNILGKTESIRIDGEVKGDVDIGTGGLVLGDRANIAGDVKYVSLTELTRAQNAQVSGEVIKNDPVVANESTLLKSVLIPFLITLFAALVWYLFLRRFLTQTVKYSQNNPLRSLLVGFGVFFLLPIAALILMVSTLGLMLGLILFFTYIVLLVSAFVTSGVIAGSYISRLTSKNYSNDIHIMYVVLGVFLVHILLYIPVVGPMVLIAVILTSLGALSTRVYRVIRQS